MKKLLFILLISTLYSCKEGEPIESNPGYPNVTNNRWINNPYKLNVIYFLPNDVNEVSNYNERISEILLDAQKFFANNLEREGFGRSSFGLDLIDNKRVKITVVKGRYAKNRYTSSVAGLRRIESDIEDYFENNPNSKVLSNHNLVIIPSYNDDSLNPTGGPFLSTRQTCIAMDFEYLDSKYLGENSPQGKLASKWIGGLLHELAHSFNASNNIMRPSLRNSLGGALMSKDYINYGNTKISLTEATAAQLYNSQLFSKNIRSDWYARTNFRVVGLNAEVVDGMIVVKGGFQSDIPVEDIVFWHDRIPYGDGDDYDAISWKTKVLSDGTFKIECDLDEFENKTDRYQLRIGFLHKNGYISVSSHNYRFINNVPTF